MAAIDLTTEIMVKLEEASERYEKTFNEDCPLYISIEYSAEEIIGIINKCINEKKDVYEMGYPIPDINICY